MKRRNPRISSHSPWLAEHNLLEGDDGGGNLAARIGHCSMTYGWSNSNAVAGVTGILIEVIVMRIVFQEMDDRLEFWLMTNGKREQRCNDKVTCHNRIKILCYLQIYSVNILQLQSEPGSGSDVESTYVAYHTTGSKNWIINVIIWHMPVKLCSLNLHAQ